jgi:hypothetical protein
VNGEQRVNGEQQNGNSVKYSKGNVNYKSEDVMAVLRKRDRIHDIHKDKLMKSYDHLLIK